MMLRVMLRVMLVVMGRRVAILEGGRGRGATRRCIVGGWLAVLVV